MRRSGSIGELISRMEALLAPMVERDDELQHFHATYLRTTRAVAERLASPDGGGFVDPPWVERWDLVFADLYLDALERWNAGTPVP